MKTQAQIDELDAKRRSAVHRYGQRVIDSYTDAETGAGLVVTETTYGEKKTVAHFFRPRTHRNAFCQEEIITAHQRLGLRRHLAKKIADEKAAKIAPHDLKVGDVLSEVWGVTMKSVCFHVVVDVPSPRKVTVAQIDSRILSGDSQAGSAEPSSDHTPVRPPRTYDVSMQRGTAELKAGSITCFTRWNGRPVSYYPD